MLRQFWLDINYVSECEFMAAAANPPPAKNPLQIIRYCIHDKPQLKSVCKPSRRLMATIEGKKEHGGKGDY